MKRYLSDEEAEADEVWEARLMNLQSPFLDAFEEGYETSSNQNLKHLKNF